MTVMGARTYVQGQGQDFTFKAKAKDLSVKAEAKDLSFKTKPRPRT